MNKIIINKFWYIICFHNQIKKKTCIDNINSVNKKWKIIFMIIKNNIMI